ncbi:hypothetical protein AAKU67_004093 [Oxalobacteraceae bacterium GrIS 2.11]
MMPYVVYFFRLHRTAVISIVTSVVLLSIVISVWVNHYRITRSSQLQSKTTPASPTPLPAKQSDLLIQSLPRINTDIAELLHREAGNAGLSIEEISYESRLEHDLPIELRSASFNLTNSYTTIRHYLDSVIHAQSNLTLDALDCTRDDIASPEVTCGITITAVQHYNPTPVEGNHVN